MPGVKEIKTLPDEVLNDMRRSNYSEGLIYFVDIRTTDDFIDLKFSAAKKCINLGGEKDFEAEIVNAIQDIDNIPKPSPKDPQNDPNLSIHCKDNCYIAFILDPRKLNWRYARSIPGIERTTDAIRRFEDSSENYYKLKRMTKHGEVLSWDDDTKDCIAAYIEADCAKALAAGGNKYEDHLNLYVDIKNNYETVTPIVIDPDVRYPGGHG